MFDATHVAQLHRQPNTHKFENAFLLFVRRVFQVLGFPVQLVGLLTLPYLIVRWYVDGKDASKDIEEAAVRAKPLFPLVCFTAIAVSVI